MIIRKIKQNKSISARLQNFTNEDREQLIKAAYNHVISFLYCKTLYEQYVLGEAVDTLLSLHNIPVSSRIKCFEFLDYEFGRIAHMLLDSWRIYKAIPNNNILECEIIESNLTIEIKKKLNSISDKRLKTLMIAGLDGIVDEARYKELYFKRE